MDEELEEINEYELKQLVKLIKAHNKVANIYTAEEYLENLLEKDEICYSNYVLKAFLKYSRHEQIFNCLTENFCIVHKIKDNEHKFNVCILLNFLLFETNSNSFDAMANYFVQLKPFLVKNLLEFVNNEEFLILLTEMTCKRFHSEYTVEKVIEPLLANIEYINKLKTYVFKYHEKKMVKVKPPTIPKSPRAGLSKMAAILPPQQEEPCIPPFISKKAPKTTYQSDEVILKKLKNARDKNQKEALALLEIARKRAFTCAQTKEKTENATTPREEEREFKAQKLPKFKKVEVKPNALTLMREAALMVKKCEAEVKKIDNLTNTQFNFSLYEELEEKERKKMQLEQMQDIKKKHLQGLLTHEEAILAKQNVIKINQEKMEEFKEEKLELYKKLEEWREEEQKKIKALVEKSQQIEQRAKNAQNEIIEDKHRFVKMIQKEKKEMLDKAMEEKERELNRKIELIKDLKALQSLRNLSQKKEFDPTETSNLGLMCEMSIAELQERLFLLKIEVEEDLKNKKKMINETRKQRQELVEQAQQFIAQNKQLKEKSKKTEQLMAEDTEEILALRKRIDDARKLRLRKEII